MKLGECVGGLLPECRLLGECAYLHVDDLHGAVVDQAAHRLRRLLGGVGESSAGAVARYRVDELPPGISGVLGDDVNRKLAEHDERNTGGRTFLHDSLRLLTDAHHAYARSGDADRRLANQAFYTRLDITNDEQLLPRLAEPFATIVREAPEHSDDEGDGAEHEHDPSNHVACSRKTLWVGDTGIEPVTSSVSGKRATAAPIAQNRNGFEVDTGFEPVYTALQAAASPLGQSTE